LSGLTVAAREFRRRLTSAFFNGISSGMGSPFLWCLSFGEAKERYSPQRAKALLRGAAAKLRNFIKITKQPLNQKS
jgi:hypothetical protein